LVNLRDCLAIEGVAIASQTPRKGHIVAIIGEVIGTNAACTEVTQVNIRQGINLCDLVLNGSWIDLALPGKLMIDLIVD
jgi:hypothetical protein